MSDFDNIYAQKQNEIKSFKFDKNVAQVFDDMVQRSVPFYSEIHNILLDVYDRISPKEDNAIVYDLGCSTGETIDILLKHIAKKGHPPISIVGIDNSAEMLQMAALKLQANPQAKAATLINQVIEDVDFKPSQMIIMNYTLQFIDPSIRFALLKKIYHSLLPGGVFILSEKIKCPTQKIDQSMIDLYYDFKERNGYSKLEIAQKREALENVLRPLTPTQQLDDLKHAGFVESDMIFRWYNFASYIGIK